MISSACTLTNYEQLQAFFPVRFFRGAHAGLEECTVEIPLYDLPRYGLKPPGKLHFDIHIQVMVILACTVLPFIGFHIGKSILDTFLFQPGLELARTAVVHRLSKTFLAFILTDQFYGAVLLPDSID